MRIGILGGTFDPIHYGHLLAAEQARLVQQLDRVLFIPANRSPLKPAAWVSTAHRVAMIRLAIKDNAAFALSAVDVERSPPSYAVDTMAILQSRWPDDEFVFLIGADQLTDLPQWRAPEQLLQDGAQSSPLRVLGAGCATALDVLLTGFSPVARARIIVQKIPAVAISASAIRQRVAAGKSIRDLTPSPVVDYIEEHGLYLPKVDGGSE